MDVLEELLEVPEIPNFQTQALPHHLSLSSTSNLNHFQSNTTLDDQNGTSIDESDDESEVNEISQNLTHHTAEALLHSLLHRGLLSTDFTRKAVAEYEEKVRLDAYASSLKLSDDELIHISHRTMKEALKWAFSNNDERVKTMKECMKSEKGQKFMSEKFITQNSDAYELTSIVDKVARRVNSVLQNPRSLIPIITNDDSDEPGNASDEYHQEQQTSSEDISQPSQTEHVTQSLTWGTVSGNSFT